MAIGPFVGGLLIAMVDWRAIFYVNIPIGVLGIVAAFFILPPMQQPAGKRISTIWAPPSSAAVLPACPCL